MRDKGAKDSIESSLSVEIEQQEKKPLSASHTAWGRGLPVWVAQDNEVPVLRGVTTAKELKQVRTPLCKALVLFTAFSPSGRKESEIWASRKPRHQITLPVLPPQYHFLGVADHEQFHSKLLVKWAQNPQHVTLQLQELSQKQASIPLWRGTDSTALQNTEIFQMLGQMTDGNTCTSLHTPLKNQWQDCSL